VIDAVVDKALDDLATKVASESDEPMDGEALAMDTAGSAGEEVVETMMEVEESTVADQQGILGKGLEKIAGVDGLRNSSLGASDGSADALVVEAALIPEAMHSPIRASPQLSGVTAEHTLVRAERLVQSRNLECNRGNNPTDSYCFSPCQMP
jgi:hypothetical protein